MAFLCSGLTCNFQFRLQSYDFFVNFPRRQGDFYRFITLFKSFRHISAFSVQLTAISKRKGNEEPTKGIRLEAYTEQSESNPGQSLGITNTGKGAVWKTVPHRTNMQKGLFPDSLRIQVLSSRQLKLHLHDSRDSVPGYSRSARYRPPACLTAMVSTHLLP